ncbi:MAG: proteasome activator [Actinomycetota bacterium]|nr:proteasome activator [Actinomycetota bacterium]
MEDTTEPADAQSDEEPITPQVVDDPADEGDENGGTFVTEPSKLIRIASMTRAMLEEVRASGMDDLGRQRLLAVYHRSIDELRDVLSDDLKEELDSIFVPLESETPTEPEIRVAQAQLVGWLEGLFHGIQASLWSQQMSAQAQLEQMGRRKALEPPGDEEQPGLYL